MSLSFFCVLQPKKLFFVFAFFLSLSSSFLLVLLFTLFSSVWSAATNAPSVGVIFSPINNLYSEDSKGVAAPELELV
jgi:hypothetical protein